MKIITNTIKVLSVIGGLASYAEILPAKLAPLAILAFGLASTAKDLFIKVGDYLDDRQINNSFKP